MTMGAEPGRQKQLVGPGSLIRWRLFDHFRYFVIQQIQLDFQRNQLCGGK